MDEVDFSKMDASEAIRVKKGLVQKALAKKESELMVKGVLLSPQRTEILSLPTKALLHELKEGMIKAVEVLKAFQAKALEETKKTNCITEFLPQAEKWACERDETPTTKRGALHGLPVSVKENFDVEGMDTTLGLTKRLGKPLEEHAVLVAALLTQGAVPFVKTNVPQIIYSVGCSNPIFGETKNPHDVTRSPGGSSGGEAALITAGGSILGIGTDMGGSIRIPAAFCGTFSIKPTQKRISKKGAHGSFKDLIGVANASGFLGRDVDALAIGMEAVLLDGYMSALDPTIPNIPWNRSIYSSTKGLKVGYFLEDPLLPVGPGCQRALNIAKGALIERGHEVVQFSPPSIEWLFDFGMDILLSEGGDSLLQHWKGEVIDDSVQFNKSVISAPFFVKIFLEKYLLFWSKMLSKMASQNARKSKDLWKAVQQQSKYKDELFDSWKKAGIEALLGPSFPIPAPHPSQHGNLMPACIYFAFHNFLDLPAGTMPVTVETDDDQMKLDDYPSSDYVFQCIKKTARGAVGLPLSVQVGGLPWQEEKVLRVMKEIELGLKKE